MARDVQSEESKALNQVEHNSDGSAKRVSLRAQDPATSAWVNIAAVDNGDGTYSLKTAGAAAGAGWSTFNATSGDSSTALTNTAQAVKASAGKVGGWYIYNPNSSATYVNFYNVAAASVVVGSAASGCRAPSGRGVARSSH